MSWTLFDLNAMVDAKKALGVDPTRIEKSDLVEILYAYQSGLTTGAGGATTLDELSDVNVAGAVDGQVLKRVGGVWTLGTDETATPGTPGNLDAVLTAGNETDEGIILNESLSAPTIEGQAVYKRWLKFDNLVKTTGETTFQRVPFNWWHAATLQYGKINEVMHIGWNLSQGGGADVAGRPGIGFSIESNYNEGERLVEMHDFYITPTGDQIRMKSYTVRTASQVIDYYKTVSRFYIKRPFVSDKVYFSTQGTATGASLVIGSDLNGAKSFGFETNEGVGGGVVMGCNGFSVPELTSQNFTAWNLPGLRIAKVGNSANIKVMATADGVFDLEVDNIVDLGVPTRRFKSAHIRQYQTQVKAGDPNATDLEAGAWSVWKNTSTGAVKLWVNDGGTFKSVTLT